MKKSLPLLCASYPLPLCLALAFAGLVLLPGLTQVSAQNAGDYRSAASGNWSAAGTWQTYSGASWSAASTAPDAGGIGNLITIQSPHKVTNDVSGVVMNAVVAAGAQLVIPSGVMLTVAPAYTPSLDVFGSVVVYSNAQLSLSAGAFLNAEGPGINLDVFGSFTNAGTYLDAGAIGSLGYSTTNIVVEGGGFYNHNIDGGSVPTANWLTNSTCEIDGIASDKSVANLGQPIWNFNWNCPHQSASSFNAGTDGSLTNVLGNLTIVTAGAPTAACYVRFHIAPGQVMRIGGDLSFTNCQFFAGTVHTPLDGTAPSLVYVGGNVIQGYYGQWRENTAHPYSNIDCIFYLTDGKPHALISTQPWRKTAYNRSGFTSIEMNSWVLGTNASFDMGTNILNPWSFTNYPGSTLGLGDPNGLENQQDSGNLQPQWEGVDSTWPVEGFNYFDPNATYVYEGTVPQFTGAGLPDPVANVTINNPAGVQVTASWETTTMTAVTNMLTIQSGGLDLQGSTPTISGLSGSGYVNNGAVTMAGTGLGLLPGGVGVTGTLSFDTTLAFAASTKSIFDLTGSTSTGNDRVVLTGGADLSGSLSTITINPLAHLAAGDYVLFDLTTSSGSITSGFNPVPAWSGIPPSYAASCSVITSGKQVLLRSTASSTTAVTSFSIARPSGGNLTFTYSGGSGQFVLLRATNLIAGSTWTPIGTNTVSPGTFTIPVGSAPAAFFRVKSQ